MARHYEVSIRGSALRRVLWDPGHFHSVSVGRHVLLLLASNIMLYEQAVTGLFKEIESVTTIGRPESSPGAIRGPESTR